MKYILVCIIVLSSGVIGKILSEKYKNRAEFYQIMQKFADFLNLNIYYLQDDIVKVISNFKSNLNKKYSTAFSDIINMIKGNALTYENFSNVNILKDLSETEKKEVFEFFELLGKSNMGAQVSQINAYKKLFEEKLLIANIEKKDKAGFVNKISISIGVMISIIIM